MRIGITGATGFIGQHCAQAAFTRGHQVVTYSRRGTPSRPGVEALQQPATAPHALPETQLDALIHLAGESLMGLWTQEKKKRIWSSRVDFTEKLVAHLATWKPENRPRTLLCASGVGFYGNSGDTLVDEFSPNGRGFLAEVCQSWENAALQASALGIRVVLLRTSMVLGNAGGAFPLLKTVFRSGLGGNLGSGQQWMPWIHIDDEVALILKAAETKTVSGALNLCAPEAVTNATFTRTLAATLKRPAFFHAPAFALRLLLRSMADEMFLGGQRVQPRVALEQLQHAYTHSTLSSALKALV